RLAPTVLESYSTVSTLPRSILSRRASNPFGAGENFGGSAPVRTAATTSRIAHAPRSRPIGPRMMAASQAEGRADHPYYPSGGAFITPPAAEVLSRSWCAARIRLRRHLGHLFTKSAVGVQW